MKVLGVPLGRDECAIRFLEKKTEHHDTMFHRIPFVPDVQASWLLLSYCGTTRANFYLRNVTPEVAHSFAISHDLKAHHCLCKIIGVDPDDVSRGALQQSTLPFHLGALASAVRTRDDAHWATVLTGLNAEADVCFAGGATKHFGDPAPEESIQSKICASRWWPEARPERTPRGQLGRPKPEHLAAVVPNFARLWPVGPRVPQLLASPGNLVENDRRDSTPGFFPAYRSSASCRCLKMGPTRFGKHTTYKSSKSAKRCSWGRNLEDREQGSMLPWSVQHGHWNIALLTPFTLMDHVGVATVIGPEVLRWLRIKLEHTRERCVTPTDLAKFIQHRSSGFHVMSEALMPARHSCLCFRHAFPGSGGRFGDGLELSFRPLQCVSA